MKKMVLSSIFSLLVACLASAQSRRVIHTFSGMDGSTPFGLISDVSGNLFGVAQSGGGGGTNNCCGTVFELSPVGTGWKTTVLHHFSGGQGGSNPIGSLALDAGGNLFGVTSSGGTTATPCHSTCGTVFELSPKSGGGWTFSIIYRFLGNSAGDGAGPDAGLILDATGNLYGTTQFGGLVTGPRQCINTGCGTVFELSPTGGGWTETVLYKFSGSPDGAYPRSPLLFDASGNLDGATSQGGGGSCNLGSAQSGCGTIFQLVPSSGVWAENVLYSFHITDGETPYQGLVSDSTGNLYGTTNVGGAFSSGVAFQLSPGSGGVWSETILHNFQGNADGIWPAGGMTMDASGNLYGTASSAGAHDAGAVFKLTPTSGGAFSLSVLTDLDGTNGGFPDGHLVLDAAGNIYGTGGFGGLKNSGVVFKITP
jgi:uncharacterized repeat protein (TIGR03803 family)